MKVLATADWHIGEYKGPTQNGVNLRFLDIERCLDSMVSEAAIQRPDIVCVSGDIFNQEQVGPNRFSKEMLLAVKTIRGLAENSGFVVVMRGTPNHDGSGQYEVLAEVFQGNDNIQIVTVPTVLRTPMADIACIPGFDKQEFRAQFPGLNAEEENTVWTRYIGEMVMGLRAQCQNPGIPSILMAHYTVPGCNLESGQTSCYANFEPVLPREAIEAAGFSACFLGHIHRPQRVERLNNVFYSGAINLLNFNDECQRRGFWIHTFSDAILCRSDFLQTPYRNFHTIEMTEEEVARYLLGADPEVLADIIGVDIRDTIVRVRYTCTDEQRKAMNLPNLQAQLYGLGAFYVSDIEPIQSVSVNNRNLLAEESDPVANLEQWLREKCVPDAEKVAELGRPIIDAALARSSKAELHGVFKPISIHVKNYRNYIDETFDFANVSFCSINGVNGAGKSSLFFDAIMDCLYEETREGDQKAWIRGTPDARSGMIEFIWEVGETRFRVVRTRMKSGKPTLNLSKVGENGEWINLSKEKIADTQEEILRILGMDSLTFRSCALIMQDQYGLFLQAKKDERIAILSVLLGLGIYSEMEAEAKAMAKTVRSQLMSLKDEQKFIGAQIEAKGDPEADLRKLEGELKDLQEKFEKAREEADKAASLITRRRDLQERISKSYSDYAVLDQKNTDYGAKASAIEADIRSCREFLSHRDEIVEGADLYRAVDAEVRELAVKEAEYRSACADRDKLRRKEMSISTDISAKEQLMARYDRRIQELAHIDAEAEAVDACLKDLAEARERLQKISEARTAYTEIKGRKASEAASHAGEVRSLNTTISVLRDRIAQYSKQKTFLSESGCIDIGRASCRFLAQAKDYAGKLPKTESDLQAALKTLEDKEAAHQLVMEQLEEELRSTGYDPVEETEVRQQIRSLEHFEDRKKAIEDAKAENDHLKAERDSHDKILEEYRKNLSAVKIEGSEATERASALSDSVVKYQEALEQRQQLAHFIESEKRIPVQEERLNGLLSQKETLQDAYFALEGQMEDLFNQITDLKEELAGLDSLTEAEEADIRNRRAEAARAIEDAQMRKGSAQQRLDDVTELRDSLESCTDKLNATAATLSNYEILKTAFSQDGVPHQIIRNIIPHIRETANSILGAMTGGTMGVDFVLDKVTKGNNNEKATLDVVIEEYGKTTLPYTSKSGGEKVKASLAVILALAEIKTSAAGIQLGMLFIDEPPFLDADGTDAYVDALETIRQRYPAVKIMAITHDEAMKARFSQAITVVKTEAGSKVIY